MPGKVHVISCIDRKLPVSDEVSPPLIFCVDRKLSVSDEACPCVSSTNVGQHMGCLVLQRQPTETSCAFYPINS